ERNCIDDSRDAARIEGEAPAECWRVGNVATETAYNDAHVNGYLVQADRAGSRVAGVVIRDERERCRDVKCLADSHERAGEEQTVVSGDMSRGPRHRRPDKQAPADRVAAAESVGDVAAYRTEE